MPVIDPRGGRVCCCFWFWVVHRGPGIGGDQATLYQRSTGKRKSRTVGVGARKRDEKDGSRGPLPASGAIVWQQWENRGGFAGGGAFFFFFFPKKGGAHRPRARWGGGGGGGDTKTPSVFSGGGCVSASQSVPDTQRGGL